MEPTEYAGDRQERREREMDELARLAVRAGEHRLDPAEANVEFHEWLARDARAGQRSGERRATDARAERIELPRAVATGHKYVALTVSGSSMEPALHAGDVVLVSVGTSVRHDSIVVARRPEEGYVVKAVGRLSRRAIELR